MADAIFAEPQPTPLLGRNAELDAIVGLVEEKGTRLLTLTGPAGVGKTRLALAAGERLAPTFPDGVAFVDLAVIRDPALFLPTVAQRVGLLDTGSRRLAERLKEYLGGRAMLLILDNFEHVLPAAADLTPLLGAARRLKWLVTSRTPLHSRWERTFRVPPLALPDLNRLPSFAELAQIPSVALFLERARAQRSDFQLTEEQAPLVARLVTELDGLPLAIELAAARVNVLPLAVIVERLHERLGLLRWEAADLPARQRSSDAAIGWSYDLLPAEQQRVFRHLGVFVGRVSIPAIAAVLEEDEEQTLAGTVALAEWSLVLPPGDNTDDPEPSFRMLETTRGYAREQLTARRELEEAQRAHAHYFLALAERAAPELEGRQQLLWYRRLQQEHDNLRLALRWLLDQGDAEAALRLATALSIFWYRSGYQAEGWRWLEESLSRASSADPVLRTKALQRAALILNHQGAVDRAKALLDEALALAEQRQDNQAIATSLIYLGLSALDTKNWAESTRLLEEALARWEEQGLSQHALEVSQALVFLSRAAFGRGDYERVAALFSDAVARDAARGDEFRASLLRFELALIVHELGDPRRASQLIRDGLGVSKIFQAHWHLSQGVDSTLLLVGDHADPSKRTRLLRASHMLHQAQGTRTRFLDLVAGKHLASELEQLWQENPGTAQHEHWAPSLNEIADLAQAVLDDFSQALPHPADC